MSDRVRALVWDYYDPKRFGAPLIMAIALSDEADDRGGGIFQSIPELAGKTRQTDRAVQQQLRKLEGSGLVECVNRTNGGAGNFSEYKLRLAALVDPNKGEPGSPLTVNVVHRSEPEKGERRSPLPDVPYKATKELFVEDASTFTVSNGAEDRRLAEWLFDLVKQLVPKAREPSWSNWCRDIRLMRDREKRTRREIAELFAWANADPFWQGNVLSPNTLRRQWDRLEIQRLKKAGAGAFSSPAMDWRCRGERDGERCKRTGTRRGSHAEAPVYCDPCWDQIERGRAQ